MWDRWQKGDSLAAIARVFDREHPSIERIIRETGGIRPPQRRRSRLALTFAEREEISRSLVAERSIRSIAASVCCVDRTNPQSESDILSRGNKCLLSRTLWTFIAASR